MTSLGNDAAARRATIVSVFGTAFGAATARAPEAFDHKFRKMAASPYAFYRGSACLFYADIAGEPDSFLTDQTSAVWIHGDLHAENFGSYMNGAGTLVFNVNDFDEAYLGPFMWDLRRFAASLALIGHAKALSDADVTSLVSVFADRYARKIDEFVEHGHATDALTLETTDGVLLGVLRTARRRTRVDLLDSLTTVEDDDRRFARRAGVRLLGDEERAVVEEAFAAYLETLQSSERTRPPAYRIKDIVGRSGVGIGSAGLPSYNLLLEGHTQALDNDVVLYIKQGQVPVVSTYVDAAIARGFFEHEGHRTALSQRALQAHADPWVGWTAIRGQGQLVAEVSPYAADLDWGDITDLDDIRGVVGHLADATAAMHTVADAESDHTLIDFCTEDAIAEAIHRDDVGFRELLIDFAHEYAARTRRDHQLFVDLFRNSQLQRG